MSPVRLIAVVALGLLAGCQSRLNPFTWFGPSEERVVLVPAGGFARSVDRRPLVDQVTALAVEPVVGGAVVRATGLPLVQGYWDGDLVSLNDFTAEAGVLTLEFRIRPPSAPTAVSTEASREVVTGLYISRQKLEGVREIRVVGARNLRSVRR